MKKYDGCRQAVDESFSGIMLVNEHFVGVGKFQAIEVLHWRICAVFFSSIGFRELRIPCCMGKSHGYPCLITHDGCKAAGACAFGAGAICPHETFEIMGSPRNISFSLHTALHHRGGMVEGIPLATPSIWLSRGRWEGKWIWGFFG